MALALLIVALIVAHAVGTFAGLVLCAYLGLGFASEDIRRDALKCLALASMVVPLFYGLFRGLMWLAPSLHTDVVTVLLTGTCWLIPVAIFALIRWFWPDIEGLGIVVAVFLSLVAMLVIAVVVFSILQPRGSSSRLGQPSQTASRPEETLSCVVPGHDRGRGVGASRCWLHWREALPLARHPRC